MAEGQGEVEPVEGEGAQAGEGAAPATDWKAEARKWQKRAKENFEKAKAYDELQEQSKTELQRAQEQADSYKRQVDELNAKAERDAARAKVAKDTGVPAELISGEDEESMRAFAEAVARWGKPSAGPMDLLALRAIRSCRAIESRKRGGNSSGTDIRDVVDMSSARRLGWLG